MHGTAVIRRGWQERRRAHRMDAYPGDGVKVVDTNVEICQRALDAFIREGMEDALQYLGDEVEVYDPDLPPGSYRGHDAVRRILRDLMSGFRDLQVLEFRTFPAGDRVVALARTAHESPRELTAVSTMRAPTK